MVQPWRSLASRGRRRSRRRRSRGPRQGAQAVPAGVRTVNSKNSQYDMQCPTFPGILGEVSWVVVVALLGSVEKVWGWYAFKPLLLYPFFPSPRIYSYSPDHISFRAFAVSLPIHFLWPTVVWHLLRDRLATTTKSQGLFWLGFVLSAHKLMTERFLPKHRKIL